MRPDSGQQIDLYKEAPIWYEGLTGRRRAFVEFYCTDRTCFLNATAAYVKAFSKEKELSDSSIQSNSSRLLRDPKVKSAIAKLLRSRQNEEDQITEFQLLDLLKRLSFYDPKDMTDEYGNIKPINDLGEYSICVTGIKKTKHGKEIKLFDRTKAVELLSRYLDIIRPAEGAVIVNPNVYLSGKDVMQMKEEEGNQLTAAEAQDAQYEVIDA